jgi:hypothetical protein
MFSSSPRPFQDLTASKHDFIPGKFTLYQNYPNPFNPLTYIDFELSIAVNVKLSVFDLLGREVVVLVNEKKPAGTFRATWDASKMPSGVFFYRLRAGESTQTKKMVIAK